jgi:hypothetical protein
MLGPLVPYKRQLRWKEKKDQDAGTVGAAVLYFVSVNFAMFHVYSTFPSERLLHILKYIYNLSRM